MPEPIIHPFPPVFDEHSRLLILGSFPSVLSRESGFYYGNPRNRFWHVVAAVFGEGIPASVEEKKRFLLRNGMALWDVVGSCEIRGSADASIHHAIPNEIGLVLQSNGIRRIFTNGKKAEALYEKYLLRRTGIPAVCLPFTSPANAAWSSERLIRAWAVLRTGDGETADSFGESGIPGRK